MIVRSTSPPPAGMVSVSGVTAEMRRAVDRIWRGRRPPVRFVAADDERDEGSVA